MSSSEIQRITEKVEFGRNQFLAHFRDLVGPFADRATAQEIELFNLDDAYADGRIENEELYPILTGVHNLNIQSLVQQRRITLDSDNRLVFTGSTVDVNGDGVNSLRDREAIDYIINFYNDNITDLDNIFEIVENKSAIMNYHITRWAEQRGLREGTQERADFINKFFHGYVMNPNVKATDQELATLLKLYDFGAGQEDINELDNYMLLIKDGRPFRQIRDLHRFVASDRFDIPAEQKQLVLDEIIARVINNNNPEMQNFVVTALAKGRLPITGEALTATNLLNFFGEITVDDDFMRLRIQALAKRLNLLDLPTSNVDEYDNFVNKFFVQYFQNEKHEMNDLGQLASIYKTLKKEKPGFTLDDLDAYAYAYKSNTRKGKSFAGDINLLIRFELSDNFNLEGLAREQKLKQYAEILAGSSTTARKQANHLRMALRHNIIPLVGGEASVENIDAFMATVANEFTYNQVLIKDAAKKIGLVDNPDRANDPFDTFVQKFTSFIDRGYFAKGDEARMMKFLSQHLQTDANPGGVSYEALEEIAKGIKKRGKLKDLNHLLNYFKSDDFKTAPNKTELETLTEYVNILTGTNREQKNILASVILTGHIPYSGLEKGQATGEKITEVLELVKTKAGAEEYKLKDMARRAGFNPHTQTTQYNEYVNKLLEWRSEGISFEQVAMLNNIFTDDNGFSIEDIEPYADALANRVEPKDLIKVYRFEQSSAFQLVGASRDAEITKYLDVLKNGANGQIGRDRKKILVNSLSQRRITLTGEELTTSNLSNILDQATSSEAVFALEQDRWAKFLGFNKGTPRYNDLVQITGDMKARGFGQTQISRSLSFLKAYPDLNTEDFKKVASINRQSKKNYKELNNILNFVYSDNFSTSSSNSQRSQYLNQYLDVFSLGSKLEKYTLTKSIKYGKVGLTRKPISKDNLDEVLQLAKTEDQYRKFEIEKFSERLGYTRGTSEYNLFVNYLYNDLYKTRNLKLDDINFIGNYYARGTFSPEVFEEFILAKTKKVDTKALANFEKFVNVSGISDTKQIEYLRALRGELGNSKRQFMLQVFAKQFIPIANTNLF